MLAACGDGESAIGGYSFPKSQAREGNPQRYISEDEQARLRQQWLGRAGGQEGRSSEPLGRVSMARPVQPAC